MIALSVVVPVYNEQENIANLHAELLSVLEGRFEYEIIMIDDGSTDNTFQAIQHLHPVVGIRFRRNYGQTSAMDAGIKKAKYPLIVTLDGDLQNDPQDIPALVDYLITNDLDVVSGWRKNRKDKFGKRFVSRGANLIRGLIIKDNIHDSGCSLKIYRKACFEDLNLYGEMHRFIPAVLRIRGFLVGEMVVNHRPRVAGKTKYNWKRTVKGFLDMISVWFWNKYSVRPLHLLGSFGILSLLLGTVFSLWSVYLVLIGQDLSNTLQPFMALFFFSFGFIFLTIGLVADMMMRLYYGMKVDQSYQIKEVYQNGKTDIDSIH